MKMEFDFTEASGKGKHKYRTIDDVEEIKRLGEEIENEFGKHYHVHRQHGSDDKAWDFPNRPPCFSHINYKRSGNVTLKEILFSDAKKIQGEPESYFLCGPNVHIYLENVEQSERVGVAGYVNLPYEREVSKLLSFVSFIEKLCKR